MRELRYPFRTATGQSEALCLSCPVCFAIIWQDLKAKYQSSLSLNSRIILHCQFAPSEVLSFILDIESLMRNERISFKSRTPMSRLVEFEPGNVLLITPLVDHQTTTSLTARMLFLLCQCFFLPNSAVNVYYHPIRNKF